MVRHNFDSGKVPGAKNFENHRDKVKNTAVPPVDMFLLNKLTFNSMKGT